MSLSIDVFLKSDASPETVRYVLEEQLGAPLTLRTDVEHILYQADVDGMIVSLIDDHGLVDDCGIEFTRFPIEVSFLCQLDESSCVRMAESTAASLAMEFSCEAIVVRNLQRVIAAFGKAEKGDGDEKRNATRF